MTPFAGPARRARLTVVDQGLGPGDAAWLAAPFVRGLAPARPGPSRAGQDLAAANPFQFSRSALNSHKSRKNRFPKASARRWTGAVGRDGGPMTPLGFTAPFDRIGRRGPSSERPRSERGSADPNRCNFQGARSFNVEPRPLGRASRLATLRALFGVEEGGASGVPFPRSRACKRLKSLEVGNIRIFADFRRLSDESDAKGRRADDGDGLHGAIRPVLSPPLPAARGARFDDARVSPDSPAASSGKENARSAPNAA